MYFKSENFYFDNISNKEFGVELVSVDDDSIINRFGLAYTEKLDRQDSPQSNPLYTSTGGKDEEEIKLCFALVDENGEPLVWDSTKIEDVYGWLITEDFAPFVSEDDLNRVYYFKQTAIEKQFSQDMRGYLEVTFQPYKSYGYDRVVASGDATITVNNTSNVDKVYKPVLEVEGTGEDVSITNASISGSEPLVIRNLTGKVMVDNLYRTVQTDNGKNLLPTCNRKWLSLKKGANELKITGGKVKVICEFPIAR